MKHLVIALSTRGYGETILGIRVARELHQRGDRCFFLVHESAVPLVSMTPHEHMKLTDHAMALLKITVQILVKKFQPNSIILSDYFTTALALQRAKLDPTFLREFGVPVCAIDTWDMRRCGTVIDVFGSEERPVDDWLDLLDLRLIPVPIARPHDGSDALYYSCVPEPVQITRKIRRHIRRDLGVAEDERAILFCTAAWQHSSFSNEDGNRIARMLPQLVREYLRALGPRVHLVHVGPSAYPIDLDGRYHWLPSMAPDSFDPLLGSVDLCLAANASSTTLVKALVSRIPSVVIMNSRSVRSFEAFGAESGYDVPIGVAEWVKAAVPLYPFYMWPLGFHAFLRPMLEHNKYCDVVPMLEMLEPEDTIDCLRRLLFDADCLDRHIARQEQYADELRELPAAGQLIGALVARQGSACV